MSRSVMIWLVLDDAVYNNDASASLAGDFSYSEPELSWVGDIPAGETLEITYTVTVNGYGELGDALLENTVTGGEDCPDDFDCSTADPLPTYEAVKRIVSPAGAVEAGGVVTFQFDIVNIGEVDAETALVSDDLTGVLDGAVYNGDAAG